MILRRFLLQIHILYDQIGQGDLLVTPIVHESGHIPRMLRLEGNVGKEPFDAPIETSQLPVQVCGVLLVPAEVLQLQTEIDVALPGRRSHAMLGHRKIPLVVGESFAPIGLPILCIAGALLQEAVVAHELPRCHLAEGYELGAIPLAIAAELLLVDLDAGQAAGFHFALGTRVAGLLRGAHLTHAQTKGAKGY